jgi:hypothetical protein
MAIMLCHGVDMLFTNQHHFGKKDLLAVFTFESKQHSFPTYYACLRHPILGGKPARTRERERE